ncbi:MAG: DAK2 domain-containing protein [Clostridia bacterium]|nr:DAK2 domain-containing protein [Clostridia bacterium]MBQ6707963.1 DAK2 domain-containing protein [Clostridia bacterium]
MINGKLLKNAFVSAANNISNERKAVDALNVFPVPDGDTGTNMSMTIQAAAREVLRLPDDAPVSTVADTASSALLRGARGNSGVILSLIFRGFSKSLKGKEVADSNDIANALESGKDSAYKAVMKPTEGTILTVVRKAAERAGISANDGDDVLTVWDKALEEAKIALADTPNILPVLKKAGVVDAGGQGLVLIFEGMAQVFKGGEIISSGEAATAAPVEQPKKAAKKIDADIEFAYCTEFLIEKDEKSTETPIKLRAYLESIGDCVVVVDDETIVKVHVHSNQPGNVLTAALKLGQLINIKIENMREQHENADWGVGDEVEQEELKPVEPTKPYGFVAVAAGDGLCQLMQELGVDNVVKGGQTMNPSTDDILSAVQATPAEHVFVLPNNKNIIMAAEQVVPLADRGVSVLHTKTIPQGITAVLNFDESDTPDNNHMNMMKAAERVGTGLVTFAARDSIVNDKEIKKGQIMGMENGKISVIEEDSITAAYKVTKKLFKKGDSTLITVIYGEDTTEEEANVLASKLEEKFGKEAEISVINGGQPVYYYMISVE